jgi:hypothetical protein
MSIILIWFGFEYSSLPPHGPDHQFAMSIRREHPEELVGDLGQMTGQFIRRRA